jgi:hypothetical protein
MTKLNNKTKKHLRETADEFLRAVKERVNMLVLIEDVDALGRLVKQVDILSGYEVMKAIRDKGLGDKITALADEAGRTSVTSSTTTVNKEEKK